MKSIELYIVYVKNTLTYMFILTGAIVVPLVIMIELAYKDRLSFWAYLAIGTITMLPASLMAAFAKENIIKNNALDTPIIGKSRNQIENL